MALALAVALALALACSDHLLRWGMQLAAETCAPGDLRAPSVR